jgi:hypothetical protein
MVLTSIQRAHYTREGEERGYGGREVKGDMWRERST